MSEERLTKRQKEVFEQICKYIDENGYSSTVRELCNLCGLSSSATMWVHLQKLKNKGFIYFEDKKFRTIKTNLQNDLEQKYIELQQRIDKAIKYIKNKATNERYGNLNGDEWYKKELHLSREELKDLLQILGDKE